MIPKSNFSEYEVTPMERSQRTCCPNTSPSATSVTPRAASLDQGTSTAANGARASYGPSTRLCGASGPPIRAYRGFQTCPTELEDGNRRAIVVAPIYGSSPLTLEVRSIDINKTLRRIIQIA